MVNAILPVIAEIVIAVVMAKMKTSTAVDPLPTTTIPITTDAETIQQTAGNSWGLTIAYGLRSDRFARASDLVARKMGWASSTDASATPANTGTPNDTLSLGVLAIINTVFYIVEKYLRAECDYENQ